MLASGIVALLPCLMLIGCLTYVWAKTGHDIQKPSRVETVVFLVLCFAAGLFALWVALSGVGIAILESWIDLLESGLG